MGTYAYLAPEVLMGRPSTVQSDLYSMGVVLYQLLAEDFAQPVTMDWTRAVPDAVARQVLQRCFAGRPEERFESATELADHVRSIPAGREARAAAAGAALGGGGGKVASLAVLPFANLGADPDNDFLADGIADDLLAALSRVSGLRVPGRTSCFAFKGKAEDLRTIGHTLGVDTVLEGSVRRAGSRLRITAQLINVADGFHLWSESYDREVADVFAVQDEITRAITTALVPRLAAGRTAALVRPYAGSIHTLTWWRPPWCAPMSCASCATRRAVRSRRVVASATPWLQRLIASSATRLQRRPLRKPTEPPARQVSVN